MSDPEDRRHADLYELDLRRKAELDPGNCWELIWFLGLPLEVRCSYMRILEARIDHASTREYLFRQACYHRRSWREQEVPCMLIETVKQGPKSPWGSIGRRQIRKFTEPDTSNARRSRSKSTFSTVPAHPPAHSLVALTPRRHIPNHTRRSAVRRQPITPRKARQSSQLVPQPGPDDGVPRPRKARVSLPRKAEEEAHAPRRPTSPDDLRESVRSIMPLSIQASGFDPITLQDGRCSPPLLVTPPARHVYAPGPLYSHEGPFRYRGKVVKPDLPFIVASGRTHMEPWKVRELPVGEAGCDMVLFAEQHPGVLNAVASALFPAGLNNLAAAVPASRLVLELVVGWLILPLARECGQMPQPWQKCSCGEGVVIHW